MLFILIIILSLLSWFYLYNCCNKSHNYWKKKNVKFLKPAPLIGNMFEPLAQLKSIPQFLEDIYNYFPKARYFGIYKFTQPILVVKDPELLKAITIKNFEYFNEHGPYTDHDSDPIWAKTIFAADGNQWRKLNQCLRPVFSTSKMRLLFDLLNECTQNFINFYKDQATDNKGIIKLEMKDIFTRYVTDINASLLFGIRVDSNVDPNNEFRLAGIKIVDMSGFKKLKLAFYADYPRITRWFDLKIIDDGTVKFIGSIIKETTKVRKENNIVRPDLFQFLIDAKQGNINDETDLDQESPLLVNSKIENQQSNKISKFLTDDDITAQAIMFFYSSYETVSSTLSFLTYELALNPQIQTRLRQIFSELKQEVTYENLIAIKYLDMVINETLRKWNPLLFIDRKCTKRFTIEPELPDEQPLILNEDDVIWIPIWALHHDPELFPNPGDFDPERFNDENKARIKPCTFIPFGSGPKACIGYRFGLLNIKVLIYHLLRNFEIVPIEKTQIPIVLQQANMILAAKNGVHLGFKPIEK